MEPMDKGSETWGIAKSAAGTGLSNTIEEYPTEYLARRGQPEATSWAQVFDAQRRIEAIGRRLEFECDGI